MSADDLLYAPIKKADEAEEVSAVCHGCLKKITYRVTDPFPPTCPDCQSSKNTATTTPTITGNTGCCGEGCCGLTEINVFDSECCVGGDRDDACDFYCE